MNIFFVRPTTRNIGNDIIAHAVTELLYTVFGQDANVVNVPALKGPQFGGLVPRQIHDMNRLADAVVVGGGNLLENGQLSYDAQAVDALQPPMMFMALSHGRIAARNGALANRTDSLHPGTIRHLATRALLTLVRDEGSREILQSLGADSVVGGCPTLFLPETRAECEIEQVVLVSVRHPLRMSVPAPLQWRIAEDLRRIIEALRAEYSLPVRLVCHDYIDLEFAAGFPDAPPLYFDDVHRYADALRRCRLHVSYRLHGFLPCLAFGTHSIHLSYDERGRSMLATIGLDSWDVDLLSEKDCVSAVMDRARSRDIYEVERAAAMPRIREFRKVTIDGLESLKSEIAKTGARGGPDHDRGEQIEALKGTLAADTCS